MKYKINRKMESNCNDKKEKNIIMEHKDSNNSYEERIYKFYIDNANEPDDIFEKKLKKEINKCESMINIKRIKEKNKEHTRSQSKNDLNYKIPKRLNSNIMPKSKETQSMFLFSEISKNKMKEDDMNISSIEESEQICSSQKKRNKKKTKRNYDFDQINNKEKKERYYTQFDSKKDNNNKEGIIEIKSDKDSLVNILSDLI